MNSGKKFLVGLSLIVVLPVLIDGVVYAQSLSPSLHQRTADITGILAKTETSPRDDAVLNESPTQLSLTFPEKVRLVKLTLRNEARDWVDINFRYNPGAGSDYEWELPSLDQAVYYTADWAILGFNERLVRGSFSFSFGPGAESPSVSKEAETLLLEMRAGDPNTRYVRPPRTEIIIDRDPPSFDPPFTIDLKEGDSVDNR